MKKDIIALFMFVGLCVLISPSAIAQESFEESTFHKTLEAEIWWIIADPDPSLSCPLPKPPNIGCTTIGKPCLKSTCIEGEWVYEREDTSVPGNDDPSFPNYVDPFAGPYSDTGFCSAEYRSCY